MTVTDSDAIIDLVSFVGELIEKAADFLSTDFGLAATLTTVLTLIVNGLTAKIKQFMYDKKLASIQKKRLKDQLIERKNKIESLKLSIKETKEAQEEAAAKKLSAKLEKGNLSDAEKAAAQAEYDAEMKQISLQADRELSDLKDEELSINSQLVQLKAEQSSIGWDIASGVATASGFMFGLLGDSKEMMIIMSIISGILQVIPTFISIATAAQTRQNKKLMEGALLSEAGGLAKFWP
jgi:hypothetical protein